MRLPIKAITKIHAYLSLVFSLPLIIVCATGSILVYKSEIGSVFTPQVTDVSAHINIKPDFTDFHYRRKAFDELKRIVNRKFPRYDVVGWNIDKSPQKADRVWLIEKGGSEWEDIYVDAFSGDIKSEPRPHDEGFFGVLVHIHEGLLMERAGQVIVGFTGIFAIFIAVSGFLLYRNFWRNLLRLRFSRLTTFASDAHKAIGVFCAPILIAVSVSGAWWDLRFLFMAPPQNLAPQKIEGNLSIDALVKKAQENFPGFNLHYIGLFPRGDAAITLFGYKADQNFLHNEYSSQVVFDGSGNLKQVKDISEADFTERLLSSFRKAHFGNYNETTKFLWFLAGLAPLFLGISGFYLWMKRSNFKRRKV